MEIEVSVLMKFQPAGYLFLVAEILHLRHCHGMMLQFGGAFIGENSVLQDRGNIVQRHDALQFFDSLVHRAP